MSLLGPVACPRADSSCPHCRAGHCPWDATLGLTAKDLSPAAEELTSLAGALSSSFAEAATQTLPKLAGLRLG